MAGGAPHFMLKEIHDSLVPSRTRCRPYFAGLVHVFRTSESPEEVRGIDRVHRGMRHILAFGAGKFLLRNLRASRGSRLRVQFRYRDPLANQRCCDRHSQSGETADTRGGSRRKAKNARILAICNVVGSMLTRESHGTLYTRTGPEIGGIDESLYLSAGSSLSPGHRPRSAGK